MSAAKKKNISAEEEPMDETISESESDDNTEPNEEEYKGKEEIQVDFEGRNPIDTDFDGIRQLLQQLFLKAHVNISQMAEEIIGQNYIGSVISQSEDDDDEDDEELYDTNVIFGVTTVLNITKKKDLECIKQLRQYIIEKAEKYANDTISMRFRDFLGNDARHIGFLINERFVNIPSQISVPLLDNLYKEVKRAVDKKMDFKFSYYLMIIKFYREKKNKNKAAALEDIYSNAEEEVISKEASVSFEYSLESETDENTVDWCAGDNNLTPYRKVVLFEASKLPHIILSIKEFISE